MDHAILDGRPGRKDGLRKHLSAEYPRGPDVATDAPKKVHFQRLQLHQRQELFYRVVLFCHRRSAQVISLNLPL